MADEPEEHVEERHLVYRRLRPRDDLSGPGQVRRLRREDLVQPQAPAVQLVQPQRERKHGDRQHAESCPDGEVLAGGGRRRDALRPGVQVGFRPDARIPKLDMRPTRSPIHCRPRL